MHRPPIKSQNASLYLSFAVLVDPQLFHPVGISEGVQSVLAGGHAWTDHCDHARPRLRVLNDTLWWTLVVRMVMNIIIRGIIVGGDDTKWIKVRMMLTLSPMKESLSTWVNLDARNGR